tara:strand:+ start:201 stop:551 length:351 start_codon:yes stop_codon:yes gene_type:complete
MLRLSRWISVTWLLLLAVVVFYDQILQKLYPGLTERIENASDWVYLLIPVCFAISLILGLIAPLFWLVTFLSNKDRKVIFASKWSATWPLILTVASFIWMGVIFYGLGAIKHTPVA